VETSMRMLLEIAKEIIGGMHAHGREEENKNHI
jgi:hypothetical protein